jgi:hypothetical protein
LLFHCFCIFGIGTKRKDGQKAMVCGNMTKAKSIHKYMHTSAESRPVPNCTFPDFTKIRNMKIPAFVINILFLFACNANTQESSPVTNIKPNQADTISYPFKALYSSDLTVPSHPENAQKVLTVWKMYENKQFDAMKPFYADTVTYDDANGNHFHGPADGLLEIAKKEMFKLDSLRFDISMWESVHSNDKNEDWVNIWCKERSYPKTGRADTLCMFEKWMIRDGRVYYFNQYNAKLPKNGNIQ